MIPLTAAQRLYGQPAVTVTRFIRRLTFTQRGLHEQDGRQGLG